MDARPDARSARETAGWWEGISLQGQQLVSHIIPLLWLVTYLILLLCSVKSYQARSWRIFSQSQKVFQGACSSSWNPGRSWMTERLWGTSPGRWGRGSWRPCCRGWVRRWSLLLLKKNENQSNRLNKWKTLAVYLHYHLYTPRPWFYKEWNASSVAAWRGGSFWAGAEAVWPFASQHFSEQPRKCKHHLFGPSGEQNMESSTGNTPGYLLSTNSQSSQVQHFQHFQQFPLNKSFLIRLMLKKKKKKPLMVAVLTLGSISGKKNASPEAAEV